MAMKRCSALLALSLCAMLAACGGNNEDNNSSSNTPNNSNNQSNQTNNQNNENNSNNANNDACEGVSNCTTPGSSCTADSAVVCAADANGCLVETSTDCTESDQVCMGGACVDPGSCMDDAACMGMNDGQRFCTADVLTTCTANAEGCLEATTMDCAATGDTCDMDTQACITPCTDAVECEGLADGDSYCAMDGSGYTTCAANAQGCLEAADTACNAGEVCDATSGAATCAMSCPEASAAYSCADAGMTIMVDTAAGTSAVSDNGCNFFGDDYSANELFFTFADAAANDVVIDFTFSNANINEVDAFALGGNGVCTDPALTCEGSDYGFGGAGSLEFGAEAGMNYYLLFEPYATTETTPIGFTITCTPPVCGDGAIGAGEACDDGNTTDGDGCDMACQIEPNWICTGEPSACIEEICGDGVITTSEDCDDGNTTDGDGCDMTCLVEQDYICSGEPSMCLPDVCGDGTLSPNETCDDGNTADGDGCSMECDVEFGYECDATGANCMMVTDLGTFAAGDAIPDVTGGPITAGESDLYLITFSENVFFNGTATIGTTGDLDVAFTDADGNSPIVGAANGDESWTELIVPAGTYLIDLNAYSPSGDVDTYTLSMSTAAVTGTDIGTFNAGGAIADTTGGPLLLGENDYYTITFNDDVLLTGTLTSDTGDADLLIRSADGTTIVAGSAADGDEDFEIGLLAGSYLVQVNAYDGAAADIGTYTLSLATAALNPTDIGTFAAADVIADQTGTLLAGESDWYTITFSTDVMLSGTLGGNTTGESGVFIYSATTFDVGAFTFGDEAFTDVEVLAGTYIVRVISNEPDGDVDAYTLTLTAN